MPHSSKSPLIFLVNKMTWFYLMSQQLNNTP
nr:MAG TPA: hypothetical protein [Caudoviricetes sp.]